MSPDMRGGPRLATGDRPKQIATNNITRWPVTGRDAALEAARHGWAVFPCRPGDKRPAVPDWEHRACADPERVARYWPSAQHNIGIACGPSRLVVVDLDTHGHLPDDWRQLPAYPRRPRCARPARPNGPGSRGRSTYMVTTATGGLHLYFTAPEGGGIRNSASQLGPLVDVRGGGGYVWRPGRVLDGKPTRAARCREPYRGRAMGGRQLLAPRWLASSPTPGRAAGRSRRSAPGCKDSSTRSGPVRPATATARCTGRAAGQRK